MTTPTPDGPQDTGATPPEPPAPPFQPAPTYEAPAAPGYAPPPAPGYAPPPAPGYGAPAYGAPVGAPLSDSDQRLWATLAHAGGIFLGFVAPLVVWLIYKGRGQFVEEQAKEALNFQIVLAIAYVVGSVLTVVGIGLLILLAAWIVGLVFMIMAAIAANKGEAYRYPLNWRIIK